MKTRKTPEVSQLHSQKCKVMEDLSPNSLPCTISSANVTVGGAAKYSQLGPDACGVVIAELMKGSGVSAANDAAPPADAAA